MFAVYTYPVHSTLSAADRWPVRVDKFRVEFGEEKGINVTTNPTAEWVARQITEAFPWDMAPRYMIRDRDRIYGIVVTRRLRAMGIRDNPRLRYWQDGKPCDYKAEGFKTIGRLLRWSARRRAFAFLG
jgi:hypothetical protein